jgi:hypothetical protein
MANQGKNRGPGLFGKIRGLLSAYPPRFQSSVTLHVTEQAVETEAAVEIPNSNLIESEIEINNTTGSVKKNTIRTTEFPTLEGQVFDKTINTTLPYTEDIVAAGTITAGADIEPLNAVHSLRKTYTPPTKFLDTFIQSFPTSANLDIPPVLAGVTVVWGISSGAGHFSSEWAGQAYGSNLFLSANETGSAEGSISMQPEVIIELQDVWSRNIPTQSHFFYLPMPVTLSHILSKLSATQWPIFKPRAHTIITQGVKASVSARVSINGSRTINRSTLSFDKTEGAGTSVDTGVTMQSIRIPPCLHGAIAVSGDVTQIGKAIADAEVHVSGYNMVTMDAKANIEQEVGAFVTPASFAATTPAGPPTSGKYLINSRVEPYEYNYARVYAETVDASIFAP